MYQTRYNLNTYSFWTFFSKFDLYLTSVVTKLYSLTRFLIFIQLQIVNFDDIRDLYLFQILTTFKSETTEFPSIVVMEYVGQSSLQNVLEEFPHLLKSTFVMRFIFLDLNLNSFFSYPTDNRSQLLKLLALNLDVLV